MIIGPPMPAYMSIAQTLCVGVTMVGQQVPARISTLVTQYRIPRKLRWSGCAGLHNRAAGGIESTFHALMTFTSRT
jgi:hypothetical protein